MNENSEGNGVNYHQLISFVLHVAINGLEGTFYQ